METQDQVIAKITELGNDFSNYADAIKGKLLPIGTELKSSKVAGEKLASYSVEKDDSGIGPSVIVRYVSESGKAIGITRENMMHK